MAVDMFLKIEGEIEGESQDATHTGDIDVLAWSWGISTGGSFHTGGGGGSGKANFQDISVTKWVDKASPILGLFCANGDHFEKASLVVRKAGKDALEYLKIDMEKVMITAYSTGGSGGEDRLTENVTLNFKKVTMNYKEQLPDGSAATPKSFEWDIAANKGSSA
jgi:type VI secretion system secreted protein Hcp